MGMSIPEAREAIAQAVSATGLPCTAYAPESPTPPSAFVDAASVSYEPGGDGWFCDPGAATFQLVTLEQRNDVEAAMTYLEDRVPVLMQALNETGAVVSNVSSGSVEVGGQTLPAVTYEVKARLG